MNDIQINEVEALKAKIDKLIHCVSKSREIESIYKKQVDKLNHDLFKSRERSFVFGSEIEKLEGMVDMLNAENDRLRKRYGMKI